MVMTLGPVRAAMAGEWRMLTVAGLVGALASACAVALLGTAAWLIATAAGAPPVLTLTVAAVMVRAFALGRAFLRYGERLIGHEAALRGLTGLRVRVYGRLERLAPVGLAGFARGDLLTRLIADVDSALDLPLRVVLPWAQAALVSAGTVAFCIWLWPSAGLIVGCAVLAALVLTPWAAAAVANRSERRMAPSKALLASAVVTALDASADLIAFGETPALGEAQRDGIA
jgi:ABC-type transport system involved in cytochrome bd biosynthesis fused ATPase/permease subunit